MVRVAATHSRGAAFCHRTLSGQRMTTDRSKSLWGQKFRVVSEGLAETDVVIFVEKLMRQHRESLKQLDHISSLHELATKTVEDAGALAANIKEEAKSESESEFGRIVDDAVEKARGIVEQADAAASERTESSRAEAVAISAEGRHRLRERVASLDSALKELEESAVIELSTRMPSHYIAKHLYQSVHFLPAFRKLMKEIEAQIAEEESAEEESEEESESPEVQKIESTFKPTSAATPNRLPQ